VAKGTRLHALHQAVHYGIVKLLTIAFRNGKQGKAASTSCSKRLVDCGNGDEPANTSRNPLLVGVIEDALFATAKLAC